MYKLQIERPYKKIVIDTYAKVNLMLSVGEKRNDGFHDIKTIYQALDLYDVLTIEKRDNDFEINEIENIDIFERLEYKAYKAFFEYTKIKEFGLKINVQKNIPLTGGLAGGSSDASAIIRALQYFSKFALSEQDLCNIAKKIGSDVPFTLANYGTMIGYGRGDILKPIPFIGRYPILIVLNPQKKASTKDAYEKLDIYKRNDISIEEFKSFEIGNMDNAKELMYNDFELIYDNETSKVSFIKNMLYDNNAYISLLCGSGMNVFGLFKNIDDCNRAKNQIEEKGYKCIFTFTKG